MNWLEQKFLGLLVKSKGKISNPLFGGLGHVFMLHRVLPLKERNQYTYNRGLAITPDFLEECILYFIKKEYQFISLGELHQILKNSKKIDKKFICFTLDDGYKDNWTHGLPIFKKYQIPITVYVTNCFPNQTANLWWYWLEDKVQSQKSLVFNGQDYNCNSEKEKAAVYSELRPIFKNASNNEMKNFALDFFDKTPEKIQEEVKELALTWDEIIELEKEDLVTIGGHTQNHISLKHLFEETEMKDEILDANIELERYLNKKVKHFAYPYGALQDAGIREYRAVKKLDFETATLNYPGNIFREHSSSIFTLPRYPLGNSISKERLDHFLNGIHHFSTNQFKKTINY